MAKDPKVEFELLKIDTPVGVNAERLSDAERELAFAIKGREVLYIERVTTAPGKWSWIVLTRRNV